MSGTRRGSIVITVEVRGEWEAVHYRGPMNEDTVLQLASLRALGKRVLFNLKDLPYVNSAGIRTWVLFLREFTPGRTVVYEECSPAVVTQLNMIPGFHEGVVIRSVYAPVTCTSCNHQDQVLLQATEFPTTNTEMRAGTCTKCGGTMQLSDSVEEYFEFATR